MCRILAISSLPGIFASFFFFGCFASYTISYLASLIPLSIQMISLLARIGILYSRNRVEESARLVEHLHLKDHWIPCQVDQ